MQNVVADRIDRLPPEEKHLLQTAAVIGVIVPVRLLRAVTELPEGDLQTYLTHLQAGEFLYESNLFPELEYTFKHALTNEVAYGALIHERKVSLHAKIVTALENIVGSNLQDHIETHFAARISWRTLGESGSLFVAVRRKSLATFSESGSKSNSFKPG